MNPIISLMGVQIPALILLFVVAGVIQLALNRVLLDLRVYEFVWHPGLFRAALFMCVFSTISLLIYK
ncbi:DUF1656 domain-containing protein [Campylobacterota bacterium DY0563]